MNKNKEFKIICSKIQSGLKILSEYMDKLDIIKDTEIIKNLDNILELLEDFDREFNSYCGEIAYNMVYLLAIKEFTAIFDQLKNSNEEEMQSNIKMVLGHFNKKGAELNEAAISEITKALNAIGSSGKKVLNVINNVTVSKKYKFIRASVEKENITLEQASNVIRGRFRSEIFDFFVKELNLTISEIKESLDINIDFFRDLFDENKVKNKLKGKSKDESISEIIEKAKLLKIKLFSLEKKIYESVNQKMYGEMLNSRNYIKNTLTPIYSWLNVTIVPQLKQLQKAIESNKDILGATNIEELNLKSNLDTSPYVQLYIKLGPTISKMSKFNITEELDLPIKTGL